jgi:hypothetical protein
MGKKLKALKQGWRKVWPFLLWGLAALGVMVGIWALIYVPKMQVPVCPSDQSGLPPKICFDIENEARRTLAYILGGILAIIGITLAHRRIRALERQVQIGHEQLQVAQEGQITERFTRAIEQLGSDRMEVRLGGIYALERLANDSDKDYGPIMETLTAYVRERAPCREPLPETPEEATGGKTTTQAASATPEQLAPKPATDIQAILTVLGRRKYHYGDGEAMPLDLSGTDLRGAELWEIHLEGAYLREAHLEEAYLRGAHLEGADLIDAHLEGADLTEAHLEGAELIDAEMGGCTLMGAHLEGAILVDANLMRVDLTQAKGLAQDQLGVAILNDNARLPDYLQAKPSKDKGRQGKRQK